MAKSNYKLEAADFRRFDKALNEGPTSFYLRGHLLLERILLQALKAKVKRPEKLQKAAIKMATLIDLVASFDLINDPMVDILRYVDSTRNSLAHSLDFELTDKVPKRLVELLDVLGLVPNRTSGWEEELEICLVITYTMLDGQIKKAVGLWPPKKPRATRKTTRKKPNAATTSTTVRKRT